MVILLYSRRNNLWRQEEKPLELREYLRKFSRDFSFDSRIDFLDSRNVALGLQINIIGMEKF